MPTAKILAPDKFQHYVEAFNAQDAELYPQHIPNAAAWEFLSENMPLFESPDKEIELTYYFRWWTYRKHIKQTPDGFVITEFLPAVPWAGKHNTINMSACPHIMEGRWLRRSQFLDDYARFWLRGGGTLTGRTGYTHWLAHALVERAKVTDDWRLATELLDDLVAVFRTWERGWEWHHGDEHYRMGRHDNGLFFQTDWNDGSEYSLGGHGFRPLTNAAAFGTAAAIAEIAGRAGRADVADSFQATADQIKAKLQTDLWNPEQQFFCVLNQDGRLGGVRELYGLAPWYFNLPDPGFEAGWTELRSPQSFQAPYGPTFVEQRQPGFTLSYHGHECQWNGPSWPLATSITLTSLASLLNNYEQTAVDKRDFFDTFVEYARSHRRVLPDGRILPWIDENLNPYTGDWISRTILENKKEGAWPDAKGGRERGKDYNHSTFCDLVITGLCGLRPRADNVIEVNPLIPENAWDWFCLDRVHYHDSLLTIIWDRTGERYGRGQGLCVYRDNERVETLQLTERQ